MQVVERTSIHNMIDGFAYIPIFTLPTITILIPSWKSSILFPFVKRFFEHCVLLFYVHFGQLAIKRARKCFKNRLINRRKMDDFLAELIDYNL